MSGGSLGIRSGSYGSLEKQQQLLQHNGVSPIQSARKPSKMLKDKDRFFHWIFKFAGRKKVGMLFLFAISAAVFIWVLYLGKGSPLSLLPFISNFLVLVINNNVTVLLC